jgi:hypothetical protein
MRQGISHETFWRGTTAAKEILLLDVPAFTQPITESLTAPEEEAATKFLADQIDGTLTPMVEAVSDPVRGLLARVHAMVQAASKWVADRIKDPVYSTSGSVDQAAGWIQSRGDKIRRDTNRGARHHFLSAGWLQPAIIALSIIDGLGIWALLCDRFGVDLMNPQSNWGAWTMALFGAIGLLLGTYWTARQAGIAQNQHREAAYEGDGTPESQAKLIWKRNGYLAAALALGVIGAVAAFVRAQSAGNQSDPLQMIVVIPFALLVGLLLPVLIYTDFAGNGSKFSRSLGPIEDQLMAGGSDHMDQRQAASELIVACRQALKEIIATVEATLSTVQMTVDQSLTVVNFAAIQAGIDGFERPEPVPYFTRAADDSVEMVSFVSCRLPMAKAVDVTALAAIMRDVQVLDARVDELEKQLNEVPFHPWSQRQVQGPTRLTEVTSDTDSAI